MQVVVVALVGAKVPTMDEPIEKAVIGGVRYWAYILYIMGTRFQANTQPSQPWIK